MLSANVTVTERLLRNEQAIVGSGLIALTLLSWVWILVGAGTGMSTLAMTTFQFPPPVMDGVTLVWTPGYAAIMVLMWWIMMIFLMVKSAYAIFFIYWSLEVCS